MIEKHGANLYELEHESNLKKELIKDFSSNVSPLGISKIAKKYLLENIDAISLYPDPEYHELKKAIANYSKAKFENIILGSGATELIDAYIRIIKPKSALSIYPSYSEYEKDLKEGYNTVIEKFFAKEENNFEIKINELIETINKKNIELVILCNPNNPTGFTFTKKEIDLLFNKTTANILIDETYIEFTDQKIYSSTELVEKYEKLFLIRGTSKFFSSPGIRLGYAMSSNKNIYNKMTNSFPEWNINIVASMLGEKMFLDKEFIESSVLFFKNEHKYIENELKKIKNLKFYSSHGNFFLCKILNKNINSSTLYEYLKNKNMIIRDCNTFESLENYFFRFCILDHKSNEKFIKILSKFLDN